MTSARRERSRILTYVMIAGHLMALMFGLGGLLIAVPNPHLWADSELGVTIYRFGMQHAGGVHILFATAAMLLVGFRYLGSRRTLSFFLIACVVSLSAELIGTTTGFPFGEYRYTSGLGYRILDEVPFTIPLSWFYMGLASYVLATVLVRQWITGRRGALTAVIAGAAMLTIWDLVLDPAMAHQQLSVRFWIWEQGGHYFDMPVQNFLGWMFVGTTFIGISRWVWGDGPRLSRSLVQVSFVIYLANLIFAMAISAGVGLWWPVVITIVLGVLPATAALLSSMSNAPTGDEGGAGGTGRSNSATRISQRVMAYGGRFLMQRNADLQVEGLENVPATGPAILVARHFHHLLDGCAMLASLNRHPHILVASDWAAPGVNRNVLQFACRLAQWPTVIRSDSPLAGTLSPGERIRALRSAMDEVIDIIADGGLLVVFPEGYPTIDPNGSPKSDDEQFLAFNQGFATIERAASRRLGVDVPVVPVGFAYQQLPNGKWSVGMRIGPSMSRPEGVTSSDFSRSVQAQVTALSAPFPAYADAAGATTESI